MVRFATVCHGHFNRPLAGGVRHDPQRFMGKTLCASFQSRDGQVRMIELPA